MTACPQTVEGSLAALQIFWHDGKSKTGSGKSGIFGKTAHLDGTCFCSITLINAVRHIALGNICFIGSIINDDCFFLVGIINPFLKFLFGQSRSGRVVWTTDIDNIRCLLWDLRYKVILCGTRHVDHLRPALLVFQVLTCFAGHGITVYINRINRVCDSDDVILCKNIYNVTGITFCSVADKHFIQCDVYATALVIVVNNGSAQKLISKIRRITMECLSLTHFIYRTVQRIDHCRCQWLSHITDTQTDHFFVRICFLICGYFLSDS